MIPSFHCPCNLMGCADSGRADIWQESGLGRTYNNHNGKWKALIEGQDLEQLICRR